MRTLILPFALVTGLLMSGAAQLPHPPTPPEFVKSTDGQELYKFYCADCHGMDGKGRAPISAARTHPADLTKLSASNGGVFPRERVVAVLQHGVVASPAHGPRDMPVWGAIFRSMESSDTLVDIRIENLVRYLESLQQSHSGLGAQ